MIKHIFLLIVLLVVDGVTEAITDQTIIPTENFNEFVANVLCDEMGMIIFDLQGCRGC